MFYFHHRLTSLNISRHISIVINFAPSTHGLVGLIFLDFQIVMRKFSPKYLCSFVLLKICSGEVHINVMPFHIYCDYTRGKLKLAQRRRKEKFILNRFRKSYPTPNEACTLYSLGYWKVKKRSKVNTKHLEQKTFSTCKWWRRYQLSWRVSLSRARIM